VAESTDNNLLSAREAALQLKVHKMTIHRWAKAGSIKTEKHGGFLFIPKEEVERIKQSRRPAEEQVA
jgi:excisionase family DNA binding protein